MDTIEKYLSSGMIRGVGPVCAKKLVRSCPRDRSCNRRASAGERGQGSSSICRLISSRLLSLCEW